MPTRSQRPPDPHPHAWSQVVRWGAVGVTVAVTACSPSGPDKGKTPSATPMLPTAPSPPPPGGEEESRALSGIAYEHTPAGMRPLGGLSLRVGGVTGETIDVVTDATGQYRVAGFQREYAIVSARPQGQYLSPCSAQMHQWTNPLDVHVVSRANLLTTGTPHSMPPFSQPAGYSYVVVLSGSVTQRTGSGVRPVAEASVEHFYGDGLSGDPTGFTLTNADGYYVLCGYCDDYGQSVRVRKDGYRTSIESFGPSLEIDFELVRE
jgi:hypothetical protein